MPLKRINLFWYIRKVKVITLTRCLVKEDTVEEIVLAILRDLISHLLVGDTLILEIVRIGLSRILHRSHWLLAGILGWWIAVTSMLWRWIIVSMGETPCREKRAREVLVRYSDKTIYKILILLLLLIIILVIVIREIEKVSMEIL